jgi:hypothetical protein
MFHLKNQGREFVRLIRAPIKYIRGRTGTSEFVVAQPLVEIGNGLLKAIA